MLACGVDWLLSSEVVSAGVEDLTFAGIVAVAVFWLRAVDCCRVALATAGTVAVTATSVVTRATNLALGQ